MQVTYTVTIRDYVDFAIHNWRKTAFYKVVLTIFWAGPTLLCAAGAVALLRCEEFWWQGLGLLVAGLGLGYALAYPFEARKALRRIVRQMLEKKDLSKVTGQFTYVLTEHSLTWITEPAPIEVRWAEMKGVEAGEDFTVIDMTDTLMAFVPRVGFESDEQYRAVRDYALDRVRPHDPA